MTDSFTEALARQLQQLFSRIGGGAGQTARDILPSAEAQDGPGALTPQQIVEVMEGNSEWVRQFENQLERQFTDLADRVLDHWLENTDKEIRNSLKELAAAAIGLFREAGAEDFSAQRLEQALASGNIAQGLQGAVLNAAGGFVESLLVRTRTRVRETDRSQEEAARFKASRGQVQAEISRELARGRRYQ